MMTSDDFIRETGAYFAKMNGAVVRAVAGLLKKIKPDDYERIYQDLLNTVEPNKTIGVKNVIDSCLKLGIGIASGYSGPKKSFQVTCDCCGYEYRWALTASHEDNRDHIYEVCPRCKFPYEETVSYDAYKDRGIVIMRKRKDGGEEPAYEWIKAYYRRSWEAATRQTA